MPGATLRAAIFLGILAALVAAGTAGALHADFTLFHWQYFKSVDLPPGLSAGDLVEVPLDQEVFSGDTAGESDLRLISGQDREVPYHLLALENQVIREAVPVDIRDLGHVAGEYSSFVADVGEGGALHSEVEIATPDRNFRRNTLVETSGDGETWAVVREGGEIYDFTSTDRQFNARHTSIQFPQTTARYLRVRVLNGGETPLEITGASVFLSEDIPAQETVYPPVSISSDRDESGTTFHHLDLGVSGIPVSRISFRSGTPNFYRSAGVEGSHDREEWRGLGGAHIYSFDTPKFVGSQLELAIPESRFRYYRIGVEDGDDTPLDLHGFALHSVDRKLLFRLQSEDGHFLYYGNPAAVAPSYDLAHIVPYLEADDLPVGALGSQQLNEAFTGEDVPLTERLPWLLPTGVALAALVVAVLLYGVVRQARKVLPPPDGSTNSP